MHFLHLIAVEAEKAEEAIRAAEEAIERYGDGDVWDLVQALRGFRRFGSDKLRRTSRRRSSSRHSRMRTVNMKNGCETAWTRWPWQAGGVGMEQGGREPAAAVA